MELSEIQHFYKNRTVLVTGVTGFVGRLVLEKLLRTCHVKHVYVLVREKNGVGAEERCAEIFDSMEFEPVKRIDHEFFKKVSLIQGDLEKSDLGLSDQDKSIIIDNVENIFHCAKSTRLDEDWRKTILVNVRATKDLLEIARQIKELKSFVYLSSAFSNFPKYEIHEQIYEPVIDYDQLISLADSKGDTDLEKIKPGLLESWPNTFSITLSAVENLLKVEGKNLPINIIRPSHILPAADEPITGYVNSGHGLNGYAVAHMLGVNRVLYYKNGTLDIVPVDYVVNLMLVSGWYAGLQKMRLKRGDITSLDCSIYHCISSQEKPVTSDEFFGVMHTVSKDVPSSKMIQLPTTFKTGCYYNYKFLVFILHYCMAFLCDTGLKFAGKKPIIVDMYDRLHRDQELFSPYLLKQWYFSNDNTQKLLKRMSFRDRELFNFDIISLNWQLYFPSFVRGIRVYLLKDPMSTIREGRQIQNKKLMIQLISAAVLAVVLYVISKFIIFRVL